MKDNSLKQKAYRFIRDAISSNRLQGGEALNEKLLSEKLRISKTPVREAIQLLNKEGLVQIIPQRGALVAPVTLDDVSELLQIRELLESFAASVAAVNHDPDVISEFEQGLKAYQTADSKDYQGMSEAGKRFHKYLIQTTRNRRLINILENVNMHMDRVRAMYCSLVPQAYNEEALIEHLLILKCLQNRDSVAAEHQMRSHIKHYREILRMVM